MHLVIEIGADRRRENLFTVDKIVVIIPYEAEVTSYRDIVFIERMEDGILQTFFNIHVYHAAYMFFAYPLMFLFGDYRYHWSLKFGDIYR